jgi:hypothetical protein
MMHWLALAIASLVAVGIIAIGVQYISVPRSAARSFGLPPPETGMHIAWWLRLKGVRDIASGLTILSLMAWSTSRVVGIILLAEAVIPVGDMLVILGGKGSSKAAFGIHGITAAVMVSAALALITGVR